MIAKGIGMGIRWWRSVARRHVGATTAIMLSTLSLFAPTPFAAAEGISVQEVAPGVFVHAGVHAEASAANRGDIANAAFVVGRAAVAVIDAGGSQAVGVDLAASIRARTALPVRWIINTHMHPDHVMGSAALRDAFPDAVFIGHARLARALLSRAEHYRAAMESALGTSAPIVPPDRGVAERTTLDLGGRVLVLRAWPTAHTDNDLTVFDEASGTLFAGDLVFSGHLPVVDGSLAGWIKVGRALAELPAVRVVPGHGPRAMDWPDALVPQQAYLEGLAAELRTRIARGESLGDTVAAMPPPDGWALADTVHPRNVTAGYAELEWE